MAIELIAEIQPKNGLDIFLIQARYVGVNGQKLSDVLTGLQNGVAGQVQIDDAAAAANKVYSSQKVDSQITAARNALKTELLGGAGDAFDTLKEIADFASANKSLIDSLTEISGKHVRFDTAQTLTVEQKAQVRSNIDAVSSAQLATKLDGTVAKVGAVPDGETDPAAINIDTLADEGEFYVAKAVGRPNGVTDAYQNLFVSVRKSGATVEQVIRGIENGAGRIFVRKGTVGEIGVTWEGFVEVGSKPDLTPYATVEALNAFKTAVGDTTTDFVATFEAALSKPHQDAA